MPRPTPLPVRQAMFRLWQQGLTAPQIAERLGVPAPTAYRLLRRFRDRGADGLPPGYRRPGDDAAPPEAVRAAIGLRREHPTWGAELIRVELLAADARRPA